MTITANLLSKKVTSNSIEAQNLYESKNFGERINEKIYYSLSEALFLVKQNKMEILDSKNKPLSKETLLKKFKNIDKRFLNKFLVFQDLRKKGYILKSALKFGADFRVYDKGNKIKKNHAKWILFTASENENIKMHDFTSKNRVAHSTKKNLLLAIIDEEGSPSYFEVSWKKL